MQRRRFLKQGLRVALGATAIGTLGLGLGGCGFQLRGYGESLPALPALALAGADDDLATAVRKTLTRAGTRVDDQAALRLNLGRGTISETQQGLSAGTSHDIELTLRAPFSVQRQANDAYLLDQQTLEVSETVTVNDDDLLAQDDSRRNARERLYETAARRLIERLRPLAEQ
ncbi:LPS assembly lipoprotein LptE [Halomonas sp. YLGW01]|uniref:LPS assembly lipoprotein LptE n=1 Tax=Halomonas sp. YLGW01 TaxID=2773308 RepID=UPI0017823105|nr:LPS assembly lipoprotein LptE [Halomonas sp. YLGW01]